MKTITAENHGFKSGDKVTIYQERRHWFKRFILWLAFWHAQKPTVYTVKEVNSDSFTFEAK